MLAGICKGEVVLTAMFDWRGGRFGLRESECEDEAGLAEQTQQERLCILRILELEDWKGDGRETPYVFLLEVEAAQVVLLCSRNLYERG